MDDSEWKESRLPHTTLRYDMEELEPANDYQVIIVVVVAVSVVAVFVVFDLC
jgi:hypothetical protein